MYVTRQGLHEQVEYLHSIQGKPFLSPPSHNRVLAESTAAKEKSRHGACGYRREDGCMHAISTHRGSVRTSYQLKAAHLRIHHPQLDIAAC